MSTIHNFPSYLKVVDVENFDIESPKTLISAHTLDYSIGIGKKGRERIISTVIPLKAL